MVKKLELETITSMSRFLNPPQPMEAGKKINELIDYVTELEAKIDKLLAKEPVADGRPKPNNKLPKTGGDFLGTATLDG